MGLIWPLAEGGICCCAGWGGMGAGAEPIAADIAVFIWFGACIEDIMPRERSAQCFRKFSVVAWYTVVPYYYYNNRKCTRRGTHRWYRTYNGRVVYVLRTVVLLVLLVQGVCKLEFDRWIFFGGVLLLVLTSYTKKNVLFGFDKTGNPGKISLRQSKYAFFEILPLAFAKTWNPEKTSRRKCRGV